MNYLYGDLVRAFDYGEVDILVHGCNCFHTMGGGIARTISTRWPEALEVDKQTEYGAIAKLGKFSIVEVERECGIPGLIVNAYTQYNYGTAERQVCYYAIKSVFTTIQKVDLTDHLIGIPKIGAGLAGGNWDIISSIIDETGVENIVCYTLD